MTGQQKKLVVLPIGSKGGVGRSWVLSLLADWYQSQKISFRAVDLDQENHTLTRFYGASESLKNVNEKNLDELLEGIMAGGEAVTLIDQKGAAVEPLQGWLGLVDFKFLSQNQGLNFTALGVVDASADSVASVNFWRQNALKNDEAVRYLMVQNRVWKEAWRGELSGQKRSLEHPKSDLLEIPKLDERLHAYLEEKNLSVSAGLALREASQALTLFVNRVRLRKYQLAVFNAFAQASNLLLP